jgi:tetratricopeptide (TPR) repeat protein
MRVRDVALSRLTLGDLFVRRNEPAKSWTEYDAVFKTFEAAAKADPDDLSARRDLAAVHYRFGVVSTRFGAGLTPLIAAAHFAECLRLRQGLAEIDPADTQGQMELMLALARCGRADEAIAVADKLLEKAGDDRRILLQVACGLSVAGAGDRAFAVLKTLVERGWKDRVTLETEPDLEAARRDPRVRELVDRLPRPTAARGD